MFFQDLPLRSWLWSQERFRGEQRLSQKSKKQSSPGEQGGGGQIQHRAVGRGGRQQHRRPRQLLSTVVPTGGSWGAFVFLSSVFQVAFSAPRAPYQVWRYLCLYKHYMYFLGPRKVGVILWQRRPFKQKPIWCSGQKSRPPFFHVDQVVRKAIFSGCAKSHGISGGWSSRKYYWSFGDNRCEVGVGVNCIDFNVNIINR